MELFKVITNPICVDMWKKKFTLKMRNNDNGCQNHTYTHSNKKCSSFFHFPLSSNKKSNEIQIESERLELKKIALDIFIHLLLFFVPSFDSIGSIFYFERYRMVKKLL